MSSADPHCDNRGDNRVISLGPKARRYDSRTTIFSPEGRLYQVEYAMEAIGHAGTCLGILSNDGIVLAAEKRNTNKLLDEARRYDSRTTIFSPEGRLYQVEYAMEAIGHAGTCLGILSNDGIVLAAEKRNTNKLLDEVFNSEKIYKLHEDMACSVAGITSDANVLTNELRQIAQRYILQYGESIPCERLVSWLCDIKQAYTQYGGKRPFGVSILYMGWDKH
ncbi:unnamed protein product, partial [Medioppia subpectinata]